MGRVVHFEIHADDPQRAQDYYTAVFGWTVTTWDGPVEYRLVTTGVEGERGIDGAIVTRRGPAPEDGQPVTGYVNTVAVDDLDASLASALEHGGSLAVEKTTVPGIGWLAYCKDTEGNVFGLLQPDGSAA